MTTETLAHDIDRIELGAEAARLAHANYGALFDLLERLDADDWRRPTVCEGWDVADMVRHLVGAAKATAFLREGTQQMIYGWRHAGDHGGSYLDAMNHLQVIDHRDLPPESLISELRRIAPKAIRGRLRLPKPLGRVPLSVPAAGNAPKGAPTRLTLGELCAVTYTRDAWLHRMDIARATDRTIPLDPAVDGRIVDDVVAEWAQRHDAPFDLTLTGPAGGHYVSGPDGPELELDPVDFCWILSGRTEVDATEPGHELLETRLLF